MLVDGTLILWRLWDIFQDEDKEPERQILMQIGFAWRNLMEISDNKVMFASERQLGDFHILQRLK